MACYIRPDADAGSFAVFFQQQHFINDFTSGFMCQRGDSPHILATVTLMPHIVLFVCVLPGDKKDVVSKGKADQP